MDVLSYLHVACWYCRVGVGRLVPVRHWWGSTPNHRAFTLTHEYRHRANRKLLKISLTGHFSTLLDPDSPLLAGRAAPHNALLARALLPTLRDGQDAALGGTELTPPG